MIAWRSQDATLTSPFPSESLKSSTMARKREGKQVKKRNICLPAFFILLGALILLVALTLLSALIAFSTKDIRTFALTSVACITLVLLPFTRRVSYPPLQALSVVAIIFFSVHCLLCIHNQGPVPADPDEIDWDGIPYIDLGDILRDVPVDG
jgi:hypothetical protein